MTRQFKRGDICWVDFGNTKGSEQGGVRPALIIQNDVGNKFSPTVIVCPISSQIGKKPLPTHVYLENYAEYGLKKESEVIAEQIRTRDKSILGDYIGSINDIQVMNKIDKAIEISVNVGSAKNKPESREIRSIKIKADKIKTLDSFLVEAFFTAKERDMLAIEELVQERTDRVRDLERFANNNNIDYKEYYNPMTYNNFDRMVG